MLERRQFLAVGAAALVMRLGGAGAADSIGDSWAEDFARALHDNPQWLGWQGVAEDRIESRVRLKGRLPEGLRGTFYRNGPAVHERFGLRYRHWFEGDGMLHAYRFGGSRLTHEGRVIETAKFRKERAAGRRLFGAFATSVPDGEPVRRPDDVNVANTSVLDHHGALYALWEGGSASRIDRATLAWSGFRIWGEGLEGMPFTAHPKVEADGTVWAFGYVLGVQPGLLLYHIARDGTLLAAKPVEIAPLGMVHDFIVTERHLVFVLSPFVVDPDLRAGNVLDAHVWRPELGARVLVVPKDDLAGRRWYQLAAGFGFHHGNGWEERDGTIHFDHCLADDPSLLRDRFRGFMRGRMMPAKQPAFTRFRLRPDGSTVIEEVSDFAEFPRIASRWTGRRNRYVYTLGGDSGDRGYGFRQIVKRDLKRETDERHHYGEGIIAEEHLFVPRQGAKTEDDGWLVGTILDFHQGATAVVVLDARKPSDGPVAIAYLDRPLPLGFHGSFSPA